jgi:hypothetical protein
MQTFMIFHYRHEDIEYVNAYPVHGGSEMNLDTYLPMDVQYAYVVAESNNQARKQGYKLWVQPAGKGFYKMPLSPTTLMLGIFYMTACAYALNAYL